MENVPLTGRELLILLLAVFTILIRPDAPGVWLLLVIVIGLLALAFRRARRRPRTALDARGKRPDRYVRGLDRRAYVQWVGDRAYLYTGARFVTAVNVPGDDTTAAEAAFAEALDAARGRPVPSQDTAPQRRVRTSDRDEYRA